RIAVRCRTRDRFGSDIATGARPVLDDELLAEAFRQPLAHQTCEDVSRAAGVKADDQAHASGRSALARSAKWPEPRQHLLPDTGICGGEVPYVTSPGCFAGTEYHTLAPAAAPLSPADRCGAAPDQNPGVQRPVTTSAARHAARPRRRGDRIAGCFAAIAHS